MPSAKRFAAPLLFAGLFASTALIGLVVLAFALDADGGDRLGERPTYSGDPTPSALVGTWSSSSTSTIDYRDRVTGAFAPRSGSLFTYKIAADGTYEYSAYLRNTLHSCTIVVFRWQRGTIAASGDRIALTPREGRLYHNDSCRPGSEKERTIVDERQEYRVKHETENGRSVLSLTKPGGEPWGRFYRR